MIHIRWAGAAALGALLLLWGAGAAHAAADGRALYEAVCRACHSPENVMVSSPKAGDAAEWALRLRKGLDRLTDNAVNGFGAMPPKGGCADCSPAQIRQAIEYMAQPRTAPAQEDRQP